MNHVSKLLLLASTVAFLPSCETTDDPRRGGLWGYMATGDAGYQRRIMDRQNNLDYIEGQNAAEARRTANLQGRKSSLLAQKQKLSSLRSEALALPGGMGLASRIHSTEQNADNIADLEAKVAKLNAEVAALRRRN